MRRNFLISRGFVGFLPLHSLMNTSCEQVPEQRGIYVIYRDANTNISFLGESKAGWFKGKNPTVDLETLTNKWIHGSNVVYFGKAGSQKKGSSSNLRTRMKKYLDFGAGRPVGHWGGRFIWQIEDFENLLIAWLVNEEVEPGLLKADYIIICLPAEPSRANP